MKESEIVEEVYNSLSPQNRLISFLNKDNFNKVNLKG